MKDQEIRTLDTLKRANAFHTANESANVECGDTSPLS